MGAELKLASQYKMGEMVATREAYGKTLLELGRENPDVVVLDADLSGSTQTKHFAKEFPERFFNMGIAECNMMGTAAGLARVGKIPFASSFAMFATGRAWEFVRNSIAHNHLSVNICATHSGLTVGEDGASHQIIEDIAIMRTIPTMTVIVPCDAVETAQAIRAVAAHDGPCYVRLGRSKVPVLFDDNYQFQIGKAQVIREGADITLVACGVMVSRALQAAQELESTGLSVEVINSSSIKPFDADTIITSAKKTGRVISIEEHNVLGGLGDLVASAIAEGVGATTKFSKMGVEDKFGQSGKAEELLDYYGLSVEDIKTKISTTM